MAVYSIRHSFLCNNVFSISMENSVDPDQRASLEADLAIQCFQKWVYWSLAGQGPVIIGSHYFCILRKTFFICRQESMYQTVPLCRLISAFIISYVESKSYKCYCQTIKVSACLCG